MNNLKERNKELLLLNLKKKLKNLEKQHDQLWDKISRLEILRQESQKGEEVLRKEILKLEQSIQNDSFVEKTSDLVLPQTEEEALKGLEALKRS